MLYFIFHISLSIEEIKNYVQYVLMFVYANFVSGDNNDSDNRKV